MPVDQFYPAGGYDLILAQHRFGQIQMAIDINRKLNIPIICLEHTVPTPNLTEEQRYKMGQLQGDVNVFISNYSARVWNHYGVNRNLNLIEHSVDQEVFKPLKNVKKEKGVLTVANDFKNRDYCLNYSGWERITSGLPFRLVGENNENCESFGEPSQLCEAYNSCSVYLNTTTFSTIPMSLLEAMACGCAVVSTATCAIPEVIKNGYNGFISNDERELRKCVEGLLNNPGLRDEIGKNARKTIEERFTEEKFISSWNEIFIKTYEASL
jgi:glycosyltransferase involved in cell wall biosynthesis